MKLKNKGLHRAIWSYLAVFSCFILLLLWLCQGLFFGTYYKLNKSKELSNAADKIIKNYGKENFSETLDSLSFHKGICVDISVYGESYYRSTSFNRGCMIDKSGNANYKLDFENSGEIKKAYILINEMFNNETLIYGIKLEEGIYAYINVSLEPLDSATVLLKKQLIIISIIILMLSVLVAYFISKRISKPIVVMSKKANDISTGDYYNSFISGTEINEIRDLENSLNYMRDEFLKTEELRRDLMANVSHDLKTPLTMIKAYAEMVRDLTYNDDDKRNENLNIIIDESERLNILVNDILVLSSIQSNTETLEYKEFLLNELIRNVLKRYDILVEQDGYEFIYNEYAQVKIVADYKKIEQVIYNFLNNAINYTGDDKKVFINLTETDDNFRVEIKDTGKGIKDEEVMYIWNKYYHSDKNHKRNVVGTGLGLSIVEKILRQHDFRYGVDSKKGKGTTFYFEIKKK